MEITAQLPPVTLETLDGHPVMRWMDMQAWAGNFEGMQWVYFLIDAYVNAYGTYFTVDGEITMFLDPQLWQKFQESMATQPGVEIPVDSYTINGVTIKPYMPPGTVEKPQKKTIGEWIESLPDGDLKIRMQRVRLKYFQRKVDSLVDAVANFTEWVETLEGYSWWAGVFQCLKGEISDHPFTKKDYDAGYASASITKGMMVAWPETVETIAIGEDSITIPATSTEARKYSVLWQGAEDIKVVDSNGNHVKTIKPGETWAWESNPTHVEVETGEYERLLAVERAYNALCGEIRKGATHEPG